MLCIRIERLTFSFFLKKLKEHRAIKDFFNISTNYLNNNKALNDAFIVKKKSNIWNILKKRQNIVKIYKKVNINNLWFNHDTLSQHVYTMGTTGKGMSFINPAISQMVIIQNSKSEYLINTIENNHKNGFNILPIDAITDCEILVQYKRKEMFIFIYCAHVDYFVELHYIKNKLSNFNSSFNQPIDVINRNISFLFLLDSITMDYRELLEQDISLDDLLTLANMLNI